MAKPELLRGTARRIVEAVRRRETTAEEVLEACLDTIRRKDRSIGAFLTLAEKRAHSTAVRVDRWTAEGRDPGPLAGVPVAVKDNISTRDLRTTCASRMLEGFVPVYDATVVERIEAAGALLVGKTNLDEFGMGSSTEYSALQRTVNPWKETCVPGGSSGGSAAAVAAGMVPMALGSDTGGSVRQPASFCGLVSLKPQYGAVSRYGLVAFASSFDCIGPMGLDATDCALMWNVLQGHDERDATSRASNQPIDLDQLDRSISGFRLGVPVSWLAEGCTGEVRAVLEATIDRFKSLGARIVEVCLPDPRHAISAYYIIANAEASSNLARFDGVRYGYRSRAAREIGSFYESNRGEAFGAEVKRRILLGSFVLSSGYAEAFYRKAQRVAGLLRARYEEASRSIDALLLPTAPMPPFRIGEKMTDPVEMYSSDLFTIAANLLRVPAVSFPAGLSRERLPIGMQLYGCGSDEENLLRLVRAHESIQCGDCGARSEGGPAQECRGDPGHA